jgi:hypothetical protein
MLYQIESVIAIADITYQSHLCYPAHPFFVQL